MTDMELSLFQVACLQTIVAHGPCFGRTVNENLKAGWEDANLGKTLTNLHTLTDRGHLVESTDEATGRTLYTLTESGQKASVV